jgi:hypothetical protein
METEKMKISSKGYNITLTNKDTGDQAAIDLVILNDLETWEVRFGASSTFPPSLAGTYNDLAAALLVASRGIGIN